MHRFYLPPQACDSPRLVLKGDEAHHAARVLRIQPGEIVTVCDGLGRHLQCEVRQVSKSEVFLHVIDVHVIPPATFRIHLLAAVPKGGLFDEMVEQATELGVASITPLMTERGNVRLDAPTATAKQAKWNLTAIEAMKQCGGGWLPIILTPQPLNAAISPPSSTKLSLSASLQPGAREIREVFSDFDRRHGRCPQEIHFWVGPEGDFSPREYGELLATECQPVTLGRQTLRCATAALAGIAVISHELRVWTA